VQLEPISSPVEVRDILQGIYKGNEQKLGDWGFEVDQSVKGGATPAPAPQSKPMSAK